ncbi:Neutral/alkaline nonlysosomal ceramidase [Ramicandelaber brevisporus]|nr:Neutral/alkaline nonlysosomal ceramidase [Ramicandelaber brevisporus]
MSNVARRALRQFVNRVADGGIFGDWLQPQVTLGPTSLPFSSSSSSSFLALSLRTLCTIMDYSVFTFTVSLSSPSFTIDRARHHHIVLSVFKLAVYSAALTALAANAYKIGLGSSDVTGPSVEINFMGYAQIGQVGRGIKQRQRARAFIVQDDAAGGSRAAFVSVDAGMMGTNVRQRVLDALNDHFGANNPYNAQNVMISGTHTHSGVAGFLPTLLHQITSLGYYEPTAAALVSGITQAIIRAHENIQDGTVRITSGELKGANINRSPYSYDQNPEAERAQYTANTDETMTLLRFDDSKGNPIGAFNWFAVHPTSLNNTNVHVAGDNKGYASYLFERKMNGEGAQVPWKGKFVAGFASTNLGDVSPNTLGARCIDTGLPCDYQSSTCPAGDPKANSAKCIAFGPGYEVSVYEPARINGQKQFDKAYELFNAADLKTIHGPIQAAMTTLDMSNVSVNYDGKQGTTCSPALGYAFAGGTTDGPGMFDFRQNSTSGNPFWEVIKVFIAPKPTPEEVACHAPKPVLLNVGDSHFPYDWAARVVILQTMRIGNLVLVGVPGELTTMSGRRMRKAIRDAVKDSVGDDAIVLIAGLSNQYTHYVATYEEYQAQRYEGGSTMFGPHTLAAYIQEFTKLSKTMVSGGTPPQGPAIPPAGTMSLQAPIVWDAPPLFKDFGDVLTQPKSSYSRGDNVVVEFVSGNPRNDVQLEQPFLTVERKNEQTGKWDILRDDHDWSTLFDWEHTDGVGRSRARIEWVIESDTPAGTYRIGHFGHAKHIIGGIKPYQAYSNTFSVN